MNDSSTSSVIAARHAPEKPVTPLHLLVVLAILIVVLVWGATFLFGSRGLQYQRYFALLAFFSVATAVFVLARIRRGQLPLFEIPVYITCMAFLQFGLIPLRNFIDPSQRDWRLSANGEELVQALSYTVLGMLAYWLGCLAAQHKRKGRRPPGPREEEMSRGRSDRWTMSCAVALFAISFATRFYLFKTRAYGFVGSAEKYQASLTSSQVLSFISQFGMLALIVAGIEAYRNRSNPIWRLLLFTFFCSEVFWGALSGFRLPIMESFLVVGIVSSFVQQRLNLRWILLPVFGFILFYPISNAYRGVLAKRGATPVTSFESAGQAGRMALQNATEYAGSSQAFWKTGVALTLSRLDSLTVFADELTLSPEARDYVRGDTPWWLLPVYPFIPRLFWSSKPALLEAGRLTIVLGRSGATDPTGGTSSTMPTYIGDLHLQFGLVGVLAGMFLLGLVTQWLTNSVVGPLDPRKLFVYVTILISCFNLEVDAFALWASLIKFLAILSALGWVIYRPRRHRARKRGVIGTAAQWRGTTQTPRRWEGKGRELETGNGRV